MSRAIFKGLRGFSGYYRRSVKLFFLPFGSSGAVGDAMFVTSSPTTARDIIVPLHPERRPGGLFNFFQLEEHPRLPRAQGSSSQEDLFL